MILNRVSITNVETYDQLAVTAAIRRHFELNEVAKDLKPGMSVLIKPNLLMKRKPEEATTTHPAVVAGIITCLRNMGITDIVIADSPGGVYAKAPISAIYQASGLVDVAQRCGARLNQDFTSFERPAKNGIKCHSFMLISPVKDADYIIDVAKLKTHTMTTLSGAVKNLFGTIPGLMKPELHFRFPDKDDFSNMLIDLCEVVKPNLCIVDAITSMEGDGPSGGTPRNTGLLLASKSPYNMDVALCTLIDLPFTDVPTVNNAIKRGLCANNINSLMILGDKLVPITDFAMPSSKDVNFTGHMPKPLAAICKPFYDKLLVTKPVIHKKRCIGCGRCAESCPAKTIKIVNGKAVINYSKCIRCYCCHEMCPPKAIDLKRFKLFNL